MTDITKLHKAFESQVNQYLGKLIYAVFADIEADMEVGETPRFSPNLWQTYGNICKPKAERDKVKSRFVVGVDVAQYIRILFFTEIRELTQAQADILATDDIATIVKKIETIVDDSATAFMFRFASEQQGRFSSILINAREPTNWFHGQFAHYLPTWTSGNAAYRILLEHLNVQFDGFLKAVAWSLGNLTWFVGIKSISGNIFIGEMAQYSMSTAMISKIKDQLRPRTIRPKKNYDNVIIPTINTAVEDVEQHDGGDGADDGTDEFTFT